jgi:hypothetical protein
MEQLSAISMPIFGYPAINYTPRGIQEDSSRQRLYIPD